MANKIGRKDFIVNSLKVGAALSLPSIGYANKEEEKKEKAAKYVFNYYSPYKTSEADSTPHAHKEIKDIIESETKNKVFVKIWDAGQKSIGSSIANSVKVGHAQGGLISVSNLSPLAKELDILNVPFWSADADAYTRVFNSPVWKDKVLSQISKYKIQILFPYIVGARSATTTKKYNKTIVKPADFEGVKFRIPGSKSLKNFYTLTKAKPRNVAWKLCAKNAEAGRFEALDPSITGLYAGPGGLRNHLGVISEIESVHDGWVAIGNLDFVDSMDVQTKKEFLSAFEKIQLAQRKAYEKSKEFCSNEFQKLGTKIYTPTPEEREELAKAFGHSHKSWESIKKKLLGSDGLKVFDQFLQASVG
ncbi:MAG: TRAP transporter substrate-binding protein [Oligoflexales bacterium]